jgi:hypothetical protein
MDEEDCLKATGDEQIFIPSRFWQMRQAPTPYQTRGGCELGHEDPKPEGQTAIFACAVLRCALSLETYHRRDKLGVPP